MTFSLPDFPDLDEVFAYKTKKIVVIKDRCLGFIWVSGVLAVTAYFVVSRIIIDQAHYARDPFVSIVETSLRAPERLTPVSQLPYCEGGLSYASRVLPCLTGPDMWVKAPSTGNAELFVATRLKDLRNGSDPKLSFVQDPERYTVGISFALQAPQLRQKTGDAKYTRSMTDLETRLLDHKGKLLEGAVRRISRFDVIELDVLLRAAGVANASAIRYKGTVLLMMINCPMDRDGSISICRYSVQHLKNAQAKTYISQSIDTSKSEDLQLQERRGVKIVVLGAGEMGQFKWSAFMLAWVSAFGMLGIIKVFVDFTMARVMPLKQVYRLLKWEQSVDFSDYRHGQAHAVAQVNHLKEEAERFSKHKHQTDAEDPMSVSGTARSDAPLRPLHHASPPDAETCPERVATAGQHEADERCEEQPQALQVIVGKSSDDLPARGRVNGQASGAGVSVAPENSQHVHEVAEVCLARLLKEQQALREELATSATARSTELEERLHEHIAKEIAQEREHLNLWAQTLLTKQLASDFACQQKQLEAHIESRLTDMVSKAVAGSQSSLQQMLREEHVSHFAQAKGSLRDFLTEELAKSFAQATGSLHAQLAGQLRSEVASGFANLQRQLTSEAAALREQQRKELRDEFSKHQEPWKHSTATNLSEEALTKELVNWQPDGSILASSELPTSPVSLTQPHSSNNFDTLDSHGTTDAESANARVQVPPSEGSSRARGLSAERAPAVLSALPNPIEQQEERLKFELASLKDELARRTREDDGTAAISAGFSDIPPLHVHGYPRGREQRDVQPVREDSSWAGRESRASTSGDSSAAEDGDKGQLSRQQQGAASVAQDIW